MVGKAVAFLPVPMPDSGSVYASRKVVQSRRSGKLVSCTLPGLERTGSCEKMSSSVRLRPLTRWNE